MYTIPYTYGDEQPLNMGVVFLTTTDVCEVSQSCLRTVTLAITSKTSQDFFYLD